MIISDNWLNKLLFERGFVKTDLENSEVHANKRLATWQH